MMFVLMMVMLILMLVSLMTMLMLVTAPLPMLMMIVRIHHFVTVVAAYPMRTLFLHSLHVTMPMMRMRAPMVSPCMFVTMQDAHDV